MTTTQPTVTVNITDRALEQARQFMSAEKVLLETAGLRVAVLPGGCSGFKYSLNIEEKPFDDDLIVDVSGIRVFVDAFSAQYLQGTTVDYVSSMQGAGFTFTNPN